MVDSSWIKPNALYKNNYENGRYWVEVYSSSLKCAKGRYWTFLNSSVKESNQDFIIIYPNPTSGNVNILVPNTKSTYRLLDFTGREIKSGELTEGTNEISLSPLPNGIYFIEIEQENNLVLSRLIKN